jgi:rhodanese-related sulfurtransferase
MAMLDKETVKGVAILLGIGLLAGFVGNLVAGPSRRMEWGHEYPVRGKPNCPETLPPAGTSASPTSAPDASAADASAPDAIAPDVSAPDASAPDASASGTSAPAGVGATAPSEVPSAAPAPTTPASTTPATATSAPAASAPATAAPATSASAAAIPPVSPDQPWIEVTPAQVDALFAKGALFLDARLTSQYQEGHVQGARSMPVWEAGLDEKVDQLPFLAEGSFEKPIVAYCNGGECEDSHNLASKAHDKGFTAVYVYKDGFPDWLKRGRPVSTGDAP